VLVLCLFACDYFDYFPQREFSLSWCKMALVCHCAALFCLPRSKSSCGSSTSQSMNYLPPGIYCYYYYSFGRIARRAACDASLPIFFLLHRFFTARRAAQWQNPNCCKWLRGLIKYEKEDAIKSGIWWSLMVELCVFAFRRGSLNGHLSCRAVVLTWTCWRTEWEVWESSSSQIIFMDLIR
jgi:hypothetical protein